MPAKKAIVMDLSMNFKNVFILGAMIALELFA